MGGGSSKTPSYEAPVYEEPEVVKSEVQKPVTEAATSARDAQKEKASKAAGLQGSILTSPVSSTSNNANSSGKTLLGQ